MSKAQLSIVTNSWTQDDPRFNFVRRDMSGGVNTRMHPAQIPENSSEVLDNVDIGTPGQRKKRPGSVKVINDSQGTTNVSCLHNYVRQGYTDNLLMTYGQSLEASEDEGNWASVKADFTSSTKYGICSVKESGLIPDDVVIVQNGTDNAFRFHKASGGSWATDELVNGTANLMPPKTRVMCWYGNRLWCLKDDQLAYSAAYSADYGAAFDQVSNSFRIPVGEQRGLVPTRDLGIIVLGKSAVWGLAPSATPAATDKPEPLITNVGCVSEKGWVNAGDDIYFFAQDGFRALKRTVQDKMQVGASYPISYGLKTEFERIDWAYIDLLTMKYFDNKIFISVPTGAATFDTWIFYPAIESFSVMRDVNPTAWATYEVSGEERLYHSIVGDTDAYRAWYGYTDEGTSTTNGTAITMTEEGREEDFGQPMIDKIGGEIEVEARAVDVTYTHTVYAKIDGGAYSVLGTLALGSDAAPTLPVALPFDLSETYIVREKYHLDGLGKFRTIQIKIVNNDKNTDDIVTFSVNYATFPEEYESE